MQYTEFMRNEYLEDQLRLRSKPFGFASKPFSEYCETNEWIKPKPEYRAFTWGDRDNELSNKNRARVQKEFGPTAAAFGIVIVQYFSRSFRSRSGNFRAKLFGERQFRE